MSKKSVKCETDEKDEKRLEILADQIIEVMGSLHKVHELLSELEKESSILLRKLLRRDGN